MTNQNQPQQQNDQQRQQQQQNDQQGQFQWHQKRGGHSGSDHAGAVR